MSRHGLGNLLFEVFRRWTEFGQFGLARQQVIAGFAFFKRNIGDAREGNAQRCVIERTMRAAIVDGVFFLDGD